MHNISVQMTKKIGGLYLYKFYSIFIILIYWFTFNTLILLQGVFYKFFSKHTTTVNKCFGNIRYIKINVICIFLYSNLKKYLTMKILYDNIREYFDKGRYSSGRRGGPAKAVGRATGARVQIPLFPPELMWCLNGTFFVKNNTLIF